MSFLSKYVTKSSYSDLTFFSLAQFSSLKVSLYIGLFAGHISVCPIVKLYKKENLNSFFPIKRKISNNALDSRKGKINMKGIFSGNQKSDFLTFTASLQRNEKIWLADKITDYWSKYRYKVETISPRLYDLSHKEFM